MADVRLSVQIVSIGRPSLVPMLRSVMAQIDPRRDEVLLVGHPATLLPVLGDAWLTWPAGVLKIIPCVARGDWGHTERNLTMHAATGTHLVFGDDDDVFQPGAFAAIRTAASEWDGPLMFRMRTAEGEVIWRTLGIHRGNHGTPQFVVPNDPARLGRFASKYGGDYDFVTTTLAHYPANALHWEPTIIYACRPREVAA